VAGSRCVRLRVAGGFASYIFRLPFFVRWVIDGSSVAHAVVKAADEKWETKDRWPAADVLGFERLAGSLLTFFVCNFRPSGH